ncbi:MAG: glycosyltransferase [Mucilaginibacter sp.]
MLADNLPLISILVAARNEEGNIADCLDALLQQDYPKDKFEIWVGDDQSEDNTAAIVKTYTEQYSNVHLLSIETQLKHQRGKSNVLAQLAHKTKGEFFFITDADTTVVPEWLNCMMSYFSPEIGVITGVTAIRGKRLFDKLQKAEWLFYTAQGHFYAQIGKPVTAMGNNMAVRASGYWAVGGYENIPFSVTEDYELFRQIMQHGYQFRTVMEPHGLAYTQPLPTFGALIKQRRRWFTGAMQLPKPFIAGLLFLWASLPIAILVYIFAGWRIAGALFLFKYLLDLLMLLKTYRDLKLRPDAGVWLYTPWSLFANAIFGFLQFIPGPVEWKGRKYRETFISGEIK